MIRFSRSSAGTENHAPLLGESTRDILVELEFTAAEIDALWERKAVS